MPDYGWPDAGQRTLIGKRTSRVDSAVKVSGRAQYTYDYHGPNMLFGKLVRSPYAKAKIVSIDTTAAEKMPGVKAVHIIQKPGSTVQWAGDDAPRKHPKRQICFLVSADRVCCKDAPVVHNDEQRPVPDVESVELAFLKLRNCADGDKHVWTFCFSAARM